MQKVLQRVNDVRIECEQAMTSIDQYKELCSRYQENTLFLFQLLAESVAEITELREAKKPEIPVEESSDPASVRADGMLREADCRTGVHDPTPAEGE